MPTLKNQKIPPNRSATLKRSALPMFEYEKEVSENAKSA